MAQGGPLLEYVFKDPDPLNAALATRWSPGHAPISAARLRSMVFRGLYTAREKSPAIDADAPPEIQSQKVSHKIHKPISQFLAPHLRPSWDRLRTREVVAAFWALPNDVHEVLLAAQVPRAELVPLKFILLAWASSMCPAGQYTSAPVATPPPLANKGMWAPDQLRLLPECSLLPVRSVELLHQIEQAGEHSWATAPTIALLQAGIPDTPPPSPRPATRPTSPRASQPPAPLGLCLHHLHSPRHQRCTDPKARAPLQVPISRPHRCCPSSRGSRSPSPNPPHRSSQLPPTPRRRSRLPQPSGRPPPSPSQPGEPFVPDLDVSAFSTDYAQLRDRYETLQQELTVTQGDLESLKRDLDMIRTQGDNAQQQVQRSAAAQRQAAAVRLHNFIRVLPPLLSIATRLRGL